MAVLVLLRTLSPAAIASPRAPLAGPLATAALASSARGAVRGQLSPWALASSPSRAGAGRPVFTAYRTAATRSCIEGAASASDVESQLDQALASALEREERKLAALQKEAAAAADAEALGRWATLVTSNLYRISADAQAAVVEDWEQGGEQVTLKFDLNMYDSPRAQAEAAFVKARKLRRGFAVVDGLIAASGDTSSQLRRWRQELEQARGDEAALSAMHVQLLRGFKKLKIKTDALEQPKAEAGSAGRQKRAGGWNGRRFLAPSGVPILVGRNRGENEELSIKLARAPDIWFHVRDAPGAHVVLQLSRAHKGATSEAEVSDADMQMAADLAAHYSEMQAERRARVSYTSAKYVTKPSGASLGAVSMRKEEGTLMGYPENVKEQAAQELIARAEGVGS